MARIKKESEDIIWDKKKIFVTSVIAILIIAIGLSFKSYLNTDEKNLSTTKNPQGEVKSINTSEISNNIREGVEDSFNNLKTQAESLDIAEIATSSPQVQKIINDLKTLQDLPKSQLKNTCEKICSGL
ncbi:MAG: hypothetical protein AAB532_03275 [Patescibacteria group bacterium]